MHPLPQDMDMDDKPREGVHLSPIMRVSRKHVLVAFTSGNQNFDGQVVLGYPLQTRLFRHVDALLGGLKVGNQLRDVLAALGKQLMVRL